MAQIFLCHASEDKPKVREVYHRLKALGFAPWLDEVDILPGQAWKYEIEQALETSDFVIVFLSTRSVEKVGYVQREFRRALYHAEEMPEGRIHTIPVKLDDCEVPRRFRHHQWVNLYENGAFDRIIDALQHGLRQRGQPLPKPGATTDTPVTPRATRMSTSMSIRILLADKQAIVRQGIRIFLEQAGMVVIGEAADGPEALRLAHTHTPDVVLLDIVLPHLNGLETARRLRETVPPTKIIVLTMHPEEPYVLEALQVGAVGYVLKTQEAVDIVQAIYTVLQGAIYLSPQVTNAVVQAYLANKALPSDPLTSREREIVQRIAEGQTMKEIAAHLGLSVKTVESHRSNLMRKLSISDTPTLVRYAIRRGLTTP